MLPSYKPGHLIVVSTRRKQPQLGQVVVIRHNGFEKLKRIDRIEHNRVYVLGDNAQASTDSRQFGWLSVNDIQAKVVWPKV
jgi:phage repressor protein C with HTH and peptisase S24 domain